MKTVYVYGLKDPRDGLIKYVGQTVNILARMSSHLTEGRRNHEPITAKAKWLAELQDLGQYPEVAVLETCSETNCRQAEEHWIAEARKCGETFNTGPAARPTRRDDGNISVHTRMTESERDTCNAAANRIGLPFSTWSRMRLLEVARAELATTRRDNAILEIVHDSVI